MSLIDVVNATKNLVAFDTPTFTSGDDVVHISRDSLSNRYKVDVNGTVYFMTRKELEATDFNLGAGDDKLIVDADVDANITAHGGSGDDLMVGGKGNDNFDGGSGDDELIGGDGDDKLIGGSGNDRLIGGPGRDQLNGGTGDNTLDTDPTDWVLPSGVRVSDDVKWSLRPHPGGVR
jgi:Ca2+-binding RTX toxin-like protein